MANVEKWEANQGFDGYDFTRDGLYKDPRVKKKYKKKRRRVQRQIEKRNDRRETLDSIDKER